MCEKIDRIRELTHEISKQMCLVDRLTSALDSSSEGIAILDRDGKFVWLNRVHEEMYKYGPGELTGKSWEILYDDDQIQDIKNEVSLIINKEGSWHGKKVGLCKDGSYIKERLYLTGLKGGGMVCTCIKID